VNCVNHPDVAAIAYCRTCGKPLCSNCTREVKGVIYCENCLAERLAGVQPAMPSPPPAAFAPPEPAPASSGREPNPAVAGILAGFFPFGVGAVYTGQYAKGLAHLLIFVGLVIGAGQGSPLDTFCGIAICFFYVWQIIDAVRTAKAIELGQPPPDPMGLGQAFSMGEKVDTSKIPIFAIVLIGLGGLFLLQTLGGFFFSVGTLWPIFLILLGVWILAKREGLVPSARACNYQGRTRTGPVVLITVGLLSLIERMGGPGWHRTWPILLLAIGITKLLERQVPPSPPPPSLGSGADSMGAISGEGQRPVSEVKNG
jgi:TM2 domain-containing membrane protein YozV